MKKKMYLMMTETELMEVSGGCANCVDPYPFPQDIDIIIGIPRPKYPWDRIDMGCFMGI